MDSTSRPVIVGLIGFREVGKTTAGNFMNREWQFERIHPLRVGKRMISVLLEGFGYTAGRAWDFVDGPCKTEVIPELGVTSVHLQQTLGTEWGRKCVKQDLWVDLWGRAAAKLPRVVNDSVRFPDEAQKIIDLGGYLVRIDRPEKQVSEHESERLIPTLPYHLRVENTGDLASFYSQINSVCQCVTHVPPPKLSLFYPDRETCL